MKKFIFGFVASILSLHFCAGQVKVLQVKGDVYVRHDVRQEWQPLHAGDILKPNDSMKSGKRARAIILVDGKRRIAFPENVIIDLSDLRSLTREELLLKLAMERFRTVPVQEQNDEPGIPQSTILHGSEKGPANTLQSSNEPGILQLNGTRVLYRIGYYATCALKAKEVFRLYPELSKRSEFRLMVAYALEKENLNGEALTEYASLLNDDLSSRDKEIVQVRMARLKKKPG